MSTRRRAFLPGFVEWFPFEHREKVKQAVRVLNDLNVPEFRILFSWADWERPGGQEWFDFYIHTIGTETRARLIPDLFYTPLELAVPNTYGERKTSHPPIILSNYARFVDTMIERYGHYFDWVQIWNEPNWQPYWEWDLDPRGEIFATMTMQAVDVIHAHGKKAALGGLSPYEPQFISQMHIHGLLPVLDAIGIHYSPSWENQRRKWYGWDVELQTAREHLRGLGLKSLPELWIAEAGFASMKRAMDGSLLVNTPDILAEQIQFFEATRDTPVDKVLWYSIFDQAPEHPTDDVINLEGEGALQPVAYHFGMITHDGVKKPLYEHVKKLYS